MMQESSATAPGSAPSLAPPPFLTALGWWFRLGCLSFGGAAGQIAIMQAEVVDRRKWVDQARFLHALNYCMLLPGPEAQQLATWIGWRMHGVWGGIAAGTLFVLPGALVLWVLSWIAARHGDVPAVAAVFHGVKPVVLAIVLAAVWKIGKRTLTRPPAVALAATAFLGLAVLDLPFPLIVLGAGVAGLIATRAGFAISSLKLPPDDGHAVAVPSVGRLVRLVVIFAVLWAVPVVAVLGMIGAGPFADLVHLFTTAAFVTFGGAYAVLPYVADAAVETYRWLSPAEMLDGLALAESTPGPTILVIQHVGFLAAWKDPGGLPPLLAATIGAALSTYVTFLPSFLFILAGGPYVEAVARSRLAAGALAGISAAVVGVILNLAIFLGVPVLWHAGGPDPFAIVAGAVALWLLVGRGLGVHWAVLAGAAAGLAEAAVRGAL